MRPSNRHPGQLRPIEFQRHYTNQAEGSVLARFGNTWVLCTASVENRVPGFMRGQGRGWVTAEYGMLPRSTNERTAREAARGKQSGRTLEIQRLIGRSLRAATDLETLGERTITLDCDVLQADGGTRTTAISGAWIALRDAVDGLMQAERIESNPIHTQIAAVSVGIFANTPVLDLDYAEDSHAQTDMNVVMDNSGHFVEIQGTAEDQPFSRVEMNAMLDLAAAGVEQIQTAQRQAITGQSQAGN